MSYQEQLALWLAKAGEDTDLIQELEQIISDAGQVSDRFYRNMEFGAGG